ncbi:MAG: cytochrome c maturation protein CcmE [Proteobacteria bacterium]|nr:cytochrome c maturation protein CcmE [Pseudomonadota bacterium]
MKPKCQRLLVILGAFSALGLATFFILTSLRDNLVFFYTPSELQQKYIHREQRIRVGGLVKPRSVVRDGEIVRFSITDQKNNLEVMYDGLLPDLFREGQGIVAEGYLQDPTFFRAEIVLAKHDETYMPKEVADRLKRE